MGPRPTLLVANGESSTLFSLYETWREREADIGFASVKVKSQESYDISYWLVLGAPAETRDWRFLFDKEGDWTVSWPTDNTAAVKFHVETPKGADAQAFKLFSRTSA